MKYNLNNIQALIGRYFKVKYDPAYEVTYRLNKITDNDKIEVTWIYRDKNQNFEYAKRDALVYLNEGVWILLP